MKILGFALLVSVAVGGFACGDDGSSVPGAPDAARPPDGPAPPDASPPIDAPPPPDAPPAPLALVEPAEAAELATHRPLFRWDPPRRGRVQICQDAACATVLLELTGAAGDATVASDLARGTYFWRAARLGPADDIVGPWSAMRTFVIAADTFRPTGALAEARAWPAAALLRDGRVLIVGGWSLADGWSTSAEIYDPVRETFETVASTATVHVNPRATTLDNGRVLVTGSGTSELFDPVTATFTPGPAVPAADDWHTSTLLADGRVLVARAAAAVFDPSTSTFLSTGPTTIEWVAPEAARLADGRVLRCGGPHPGSSGGGTRTEAELFLPATRTFVPGGEMIIARAGHALTLLPDDRALVTGGYIGLGGPVEIYESAELYDPATRTFALTTRMTTSRTSHTATLLPNGRVLVAGGTTDFGVVGDPDAPTGVTPSAELYDPATATFVATSEPMETARTDHTATRLLDGRVLIVGGRDVTATSTAELYIPDLTVRP